MGRAAMLTGMVNIAVFAAFHTVIGDVPRVNAEFKPCGVVWQLDIARYGWQKRQDVARRMARSGKAGGKSGTVLGRCRGMQGYAAAGARG